MLGIIGKTISLILKERFDYTIYRTTPIEKKYMKSHWAHLISIDPVRFSETYLMNRQTLRTVPSWISQATLESSYWRYGVPVEWDRKFSELTDRQLNDVSFDITYSDILAFLASYLPKLTYLEIGVSAGKNFVQLCNAVKNSAVYGIDVEELNPILLKILGESALIWRSDQPSEIATLSGSSAIKFSSLHKLTFNSNDIFYLSADQFRADTWKALGSIKFNMIFSDGIHNASALRKELEYLLTNELIDQTNFVMFWDDLWGTEMQNAFLDNVSKLCTYFNCDESAISMYKMRGTYGNDRPMGIFLSPSFSSAMNLVSRIEKKSSQRRQSNIGA